MMKDRVKNVPAYARDYKFWVVRVVDTEMWFYGAWNDINKAREVAHDVEGLVLTD